MVEAPQLSMRILLTPERVQRMVSLRHPQDAVNWYYVEQKLAESGAVCENDPFDYQFYARFDTEQQALLFVLKYG